MMAEGTNLNDGAHRNLTAEKMMCPAKECERVPAQEDSQLLLPMGACYPHSLSIFCPFFDFSNSCPPVIIYVSKFPK